ncbi:MAG: Radical domain protein [Gemmatimonadetes bacterium]|nr:Radical domain protein [Gemmatimonadota bacterium]
MRPYSPLATLLIAASLREHGHDVAFFDATLSPGVHEFDAMLRKTRPTVVGILEDNFNYLTKMCTVRTREATLSMVAAARAFGCKVAVNGSDSSDHPQLYLDAGAEAVLPGEADVSFLGLAHAWRASVDVDLRDVPGLIIASRDGGVVRTGPARSIGDLNALPLPAWDLVDVDAYRQAWTSAHGRFSWNMISSRGCPFGCNWCAKPIFGRRYSQRSPECVADEMVQLRASVRPDHIWFADDIFGLTARWMTQFASAVAARNVRTPFMIQCRADLLGPEVVAALADAGAEEVWLGVESGSQRIVDAMEKDMRIDDVRRATRALRAHGIRACWFLQLGYPSEAWEDVLQTRDLVREERPDDIGVSVAYPLPGTGFHRMVKAQLGLHRNWQDTDDLAMLFHGTYTTAFYRELRDALHEEARAPVANDDRWNALARDEWRHRSAEPLVAANA